MNILVVDDEQLALEYLTGILEEIFDVGVELPDKEVLYNKKKHVNIVGFSKCKDAIEYYTELINKNERVEYAFLDIKMRGMRGIELAKILKDLNPKVKIIFVTGYKEYSFDAYQLHASGYIFKPADKEKITEVLENIDGNWKKAISEDEEQKIVIQTFGNFEIFADNKIVTFKRSKSKELLAYLVDRRGASLTTAQLCGILWEDKEYGFSIQRQFQTIVTEMMKSLKEFGAEKIIVKTRNSYAVNTSNFKCDYYDYMAGDAIAVNSYMGEYMAQYSWAELTMSEFM